MEQPTVFSLDSLLSTDAAARRSSAYGSRRRRRRDAHQHRRGAARPRLDAHDDLIAAAGRVLSTDRTALLYGDRQGYRPLREIVTRKALRLESLEVDPDDVLITTAQARQLR